MRQQYEFVDFQGKEHLVEEIQKLEEKLQKETGEIINLIAYSPQGSNRSRDGQKFN